MAEVDPTSLVKSAAGLLDTVRDTAPLIHNITNNVVQNISADAILAVGATQATVHPLEEARELASISSAVSINLGTPWETWAEAARIATEVAHAQSIPWVMDPVAVGLLPYRTELAHTLLAHQPTVIKGNASEIMAFAGEAATTHGADSLHQPEQARDAAVRLASDTGAVVAVTGAVDLVTDGERAVRIGNGHAMMPAVVGTGCMLTPVIAAFLAVGDDAFTAATGAVSAMGLAGERAAATATGPGTMRPLIIDALYHLTSSDMAAGMKLS